ncbi:Cytochrome P450 [Amycolatopsis arida]|uniref:Cytochrome P450 n=1 Tax=Amycolatopsis arida TaxID=587909 RepID=A0A1I5US30_9PSEU|nr:cytochrome P450 [Amycolatopsis arida]TDX90998.1 cytochrome P450 [Amycolatopsis arida]SFP97536.1 Cytochrome P450 [Amycolatopsis arida]
MADVLPTTRHHPFDPPAGLAALGDRDTPHRLRFADGHEGWLVTSYALARAVLADPRFSARSELRHSPVRRPRADDLGPGGRTPPGFFIGMDPPEHTRFRRLLAGEFTVRRMDRLRPRIEAIVGERLDAMAAAGPPVDLVPEFALPVPSLVICELLGVPYADRDRFQRDSAALLRLDVTDEVATAAVRGLREYLRDLVRRLRAEPGEDLLSALAAGDRLTEDELVGIAFLLLVAGHETTANMLALGTFAALGEPDLLAAFRGSAEDVAAAVEELLRYLSIVHFGVSRTAKEDVELAGQRIRAGECVLAWLPAANRDPERFPDPDRPEPARAGAGHLAFGHGVHQCLGQQLARMELRIGFTALFARFPGLRLAVPAEEVPLRHDMGVYGVHRLPVTW